MTPAEEKEILAEMEVETIDPEFSRRAGRAMNAPYWTANIPDNVPDEQVGKFIEDRRAERDTVETALQTALSYKDLTGEAKAIFDKAEKTLSTVPKNAREMKKRAQESNAKSKAKQEAAPKNPAKDENEPVENAADIIITAAGIKLPTAQIVNVFCPTGPGGGVDPTCSPGQRGGPVDPPTRPLGPWANDAAIKEHARKMVAAHDSDPQTRQLEDAFKAKQEEVKQLEDKMRAVAPSGLAIIDHGEYRQISRDLGEASTQAKLLQQGVEHNSRRSMLMAFRVPLDQQTKYDFDTGPSTSHAAQNWRKAEDYLREISSKDGLGDAVRGDVRATNGRAYHSFRTIYTGPHDDPGVSVHEFGHYIENHNRWAMDRAQQFRASRFPPEKNRPMKDFGPERGYSRNEVGNPDKMLSTFKDDLSNAAYSGKTYPDGQTEVTSMGIEQLYRDPVHLARTNPDYFTLIVSMLQRGPRRA